MLGRVAVFMDHAVVLVGLWLAHDAEKQVLVMDVEGTDSKERGETHIVCVAIYIPL